NVVPDIEAYAKGITSGYVPLGATIINKKLADHFDEKGFPHSYTYSGHPLACAAALATIDYYFEENLVERTAEMGGYFMEGLEAIQDRHGTIGEIRGKGLFVGVELVANREKKEKIQPEGLTPEESRDPEKNPMTYFSDTCKDKGLTLGISPGTGILRMMPCLTITKEQIDEGLKILEDALEAMEKKFDLPKKT
ncbi:MAG: aminotransferase class III-fold pyridoxal phosphate-dependent enzyme, partial [Candidatus Bathyarchaeia archaeon]